jgi:GxxExxY protein
MKVFEPLDPKTEGIAKAIVDSAFKVHRTLGPGLLESVYELCLAHELRRRGLQLEAQVKLPIVYEDLTIDAGLRLDLIVERRIIVEVKAVEKMHPVFDAQLLTYIKLTKLRLGFLINFNVPLIRDGIKRILL